jgi:hypothetical protein
VKKFLEGLIAAVEKRKNNTGKRGKEAPENGQASNWSNDWNRGQAKWKSRRKWKNLILFGLWFL